MPVITTPSSPEYAAALPVLFVPPSVQLQRRIFPEASELGEVLAETFELYNPTAETVTCILLPSACPYLLSDLQCGTILCGALSTVRALSVAPDHTVYGIRFRCGCGSWFPGQPPASDSVTVPQDHPATFAPLFRALNASSDFNQRNAALLRLAATQGGRSYHRHPLLRQCLALIEQHHGQIRVSALARTVGCSERYLHRLFSAQVGLSAKTCCQLVQLHTSLHTLLTTQPKSLLHVAVSCGYFDQAHMNRQYHRFLSASANDMRRGNGFLLPAPPLSWSTNDSAQEDII